MNGHNPIEGERIRTRVFYDERSLDFFTSKSEIRVLDIQHSMVSQLKKADFVYTLKDHYENESRFALIYQRVASDEKEENKIKIEVKKEHDWDYHKLACRICGISIDEYNLQRAKKDGCERVC